MTQLSTPQLSTPESALPPIVPQPPAPTPAGAEVIKAAPAAVKRSMPMALSITLGILLAAASGLFFYKLTCFLLILYLSFIVATILEAPVEWLKKINIRRGPAAVIVMAGGLSILALLFYLIANDLYGQISSISTNLESSPKHINDWVHHLKSVHSGIGNRLDEFDVAKVAANALPSLSAVMDNAVNGFAIITWLVVMFFLVLYMLVDGADHLKAIRALLPKNIRLDATNLFNDIAKAHRGWALASICNIASSTILTSVGLSLIGVPGALLLGFFAGLGELIPNIGPLICSAPVLLLILVAQPDKFTLVLGMFFVVWTIQGYGISPLMMKFSVKLPVLVTIIAVLVFGILFGFLGILVAIPLVADLVVLWSFQSARREKDTTDYDTVNLSPEARHSILPDHAHPSRLEKFFRRQRRINPIESTTPANPSGLTRLEQAETRASK